MYNITRIKKFSEGCSLSQMQTYIWFDRYTYLNRFYEVGFKGCMQ